MLKTLSSLLSTFLFFAVVIIVIIISSLFEYSVTLPDYRQLEKYEPKVTTRLYAGDGRLLMEYASEKRFFVPVDKIPDKVKQAFISAEDKNFYRHSGLDYKGIARAALGNIAGMFSGRRPSGASTITQQVAKNFLLTPEVSYKRKIKEALLAFRIEDAFSKSHILELYLNEIYLGNRSYGVASAALNYFGKPLDKLNLEEMAYLAALPKGPNNYNPKKHMERAVARRNWVLERMAADGYITEDEAAQAQAKPLVTLDRNNEFIKDAQYFSEEVRRRVTKRFGEDALYEGGMIIRTTVDPKLQEIATDIFQNQILQYDRRHGWRGAPKNISLEGDYLQALKASELPKGKREGWEKAVVTAVSADKAAIKTEAGLKGQIPLSVLDWARKVLPNQGIGGAPKSVADVLKAGDVVYVEKISEKTARAKKLADNAYELRQIPDVEGGLIAMDPHTGKVLALVGGYDFAKSQFNRATQAKRQTGSAFKPFVYMAALDNGYSPTDLILDAPFVLNQGPGLPLWKPSNYSKGFSGLTTLRQGIEKSKNLMTVRLAQDIGMERVSEMAKRLGVMDNLPHLLSMSLGAADTRLIDMATAYSVFVNGGKKVSPYLIEQIQDRYGKGLYKNTDSHCLGCLAAHFDEKAEVPVITDDRAQVLDELTAYQMVSILQGVAIRGTGAKLASLHKNLAGKTGTTNENKDAWFMGFSPDMVVGIYVGFDEPRTLGRIETGAAAALPIFYDFMKEALADKPNLEFRVPKGIRFVRVNPKTGKPATLDDRVVIYEALKPDFRFGDNQRVIGDGGVSMLDEESDDGGFSLGSEY